MKMHNVRVMVAGVAFMFCFGFLVPVAESAQVRQVSGEITWIDLKLGKLQLKADKAEPSGEITEYRITGQETRVTDPTDKKLLTIEDLQAGQHVTIDVVNGEEEKIVKKVTADPKTVSEYKEVYGEIEALVHNGVTLIAVRAAGYNNIDLKAVFKKIHVVRVPAYSPYAVAEHAVALMLALNRKVHRAYYRTRDNNFTLNGLLGFDMNGKTAGIIGTGKVGKVAIEILKGFGMKVIAYDAFPDNEYQRSAGFSYVDIDTVLRDSDIISLHCPLTKETYHLVNETTIGKMKPGIMIINTGRGMLIDSKALIEGLKSGKVGFAGLDVYEEEGEYFFEDFSNKVITDDILARLLSFNNVVITAHQGFFTQEALKNIAVSTLENIRDFFTEQKLPNEICYKCGVDPCPRKTTGKCY